MKSIHIKQVLVLCTLLVGIVATMSASAADLGSSCVFTKEPKAAFHIDPWAKSGQRFQRFGAVENTDEINIQSCKGATNQYLALVIGTRESSLASDGGNIVTSSDLGQERCDFSPGIKAIPWLIPQTQREASIKNRLKTLRSCVALEVTSLNGRPLILGNHPSCTWTTTKSNVYEARGATCTLKLETNTAIAVKPIIEESCQTPARFESGELQPADIETAFQAFITSDALASSTSNLVGVSARRIVFAPSPKVAPFNPEDKIRFPRTLDLKIQPTALDLSTQRTKEDATSFVSLQLLVRNIGSRASSYPVPLAADAELFELSKDASGKEKLKSAGSWTAYASGRTLIPADWSGIFATDRAELRDFAFKNRKRYRIRLKYYHPHDVAGLLRAEFRSRPMSFIPNSDSFDIGTIPTMAMMNMAVGACVYMAEQRTIM